MRFSAAALGLLLTLSLAAAACGGSVASPPQGGESPTTSKRTETTDTSQPAGTAAPADLETPAQDAAPGEETAPVSITGDPLPEADGNGVIDDATTDPAIGSVAPTLNGTNFNGLPVSIGPDGRAKVVYFLAHWCPHCQEEVRLIKELAAAGEVPDSVDLYGVTIAVAEGRENYPPSAWMADFPGTVMRDSAENEAAIASGVSGIPYTLYLDADNRLVSRSVGSLTKDQIRAQWQSLLPISS